MKFFASILLGMTFILGVSEPHDALEEDESLFFILDKKDFGAPYEFPNNICIVTTDGDSHTFDSDVEECLNKKHSWLKVSSGRQPF